MRPHLPCCQQAYHLVSPCRPSCLSSACPLSCQSILSSSFLPSSFPPSALFAVIRVSCEGGVLQCIEIQWIIKQYAAYVVYCFVRCWFADVYKTPPVLLPAGLPSFRPSYPLLALCLNLCLPFLPSALSVRLIFCFCPPLPYRLPCRQAAADILAWFQVPP